ncbi:hypothetical protein [Mucilaginibacter sp. AK015]|uniref:hypothetical protein n=1 Tax=Mucilaginibacter sp. AK015 TaxID=2723072 RepID=UPI001611ED90|nr:hypothetical protein [Mucilaginibacter sp. AK015]MBB5395640.1 putative flippase GtrA [Mucilaginibacter sp. AK015]
MEKKYTFWERLTSDTPTFFKRMQVFGISLAGMGTSLSQITGMPVKLTTIIIAIGSTIAVLAQFAVKQYEPLND